MGEVSFNPTLTPEHVTISGNLGRTRLTAESVIDKVQSTWAEQRAVILRLPSQEEGMNMDRVHGFRERYDIPGREIRVLTPGDYEKATRITGSAPGGEDGRFLNRLGIIIINRDPDVEQINGGTRYLESLTVHEIAHSDVASPTVSVDVIVGSGLLRKKATFEVNDVRTGFLELGDDNKFVGHALEEGYAELIRGRYLREELDMEVGFGGMIVPNQSSPIDIYTLMERTEDGNVAKTIMEGATAAVVFDLLVAKDQLLLPAMHTGRHTEDGLGELKKRMNNVRPGIYDGLRKVDLKADDGYLRIKDIL